MDDADTMIAKPAAGQSSVDFGFVSDQKKGRDPIIGLERANRAFDDDPAAVVSAHDIDGNAHKVTGASVPHERALCVKP